MEVKKIYFKRFKMHRVVFDFSEEELRRAKITKDAGININDKADVHLTNHEEIVFNLLDIIRKQQEELDANRTARN